MQYRYRAYNSAGAVVTGLLEGTNEHEVIAKLGSKDLMVAGLEPVVAKERRKGKAPKVPLAILCTFTRQLATMTRAGLPFLRCLDSLGRQSTHPGLQTVARGLSKSIEGGEAFSEALRAYPTVFSPIYVSMVKAGESGGMMPEVLDRMAGYLEMSLRLRQRVRSAMMYPIIVSVAGIGICIFMITCIIPVFVDIFKEFQHSLPLPTLVLITVSTWLRKNLLICLAAGVGMFFLLRYLRRTPAGALFWDRFKLRAPVFGPLANKIAFSRFARTLSSMMHSGVPVLKALSIAGTAVSNVVLEASIRRVHDYIEQGSTVHAAMQKENKFPGMMLEMVAAGEETGAIDELLTQVADHYDREIDTTLAGLTSILEPLLILFLGVVVGGVVIAMFLPIFKMADAVQF